MLYLDITAVLCVLVSLGLLNSWRTRRKRSTPLPPGPKGLPVIGNALDMPEAEVWEAARKWGEKYGPIVHVRNLGASYIFLNSCQAAVDLFEKRGANYSSRPTNTMLELEDWNWFVSLMPYGDEHRRSRQLLHRFFRSSAVGEFTELQTQSAHKMLESLLRNPDKFPEVLRHSISATTLMLSYGYKALEKEDPYIALIDKGIEAISECEDFFLVNAFPWLQYLPAWFPGTRFKKIVERGHNLAMEMYHEPHKMTKEKLLDGSAAPSVTSKLLEAMGTGDAVVNDESLIQKVASVIYAGGADTSISALHTFFLAMVLYPDTQKRAQEELDRVVGKDTLPSFDDRESLSYIEAIIKETLRWQPVVPLAVAHTVEEDDEYNGFFIPAGSAVFSNIWAMLRDPKEYPEPHQFVPERWLPSEGDTPLDGYKVVFGIGRRICSGRHFAESSLFINIASLLSAFDISKALEENGAPIMPSGEYTTGFVRHPKPFKYALKPRSDKMESIIRQAAESAK